MDHKGFLSQRKFLLNPPMCKLLTVLDRLPIRLAFQSMRKSRPALDAPRTQVSHHRNRSNVLVVPRRSVESTERATGEDTTGKNIEAKSKPSLARWDATRSTRERMRCRSIIEVAATGRELQMVPKRWKHFSTRTFAHHSQFG